MIPSPAGDAAPGPVRLEESVPLVYALVDHVARTAGIRALAIKGPVLHAQGLRAPRTSVDVDVLVEPGAVQRLADELSRAGWRDQGRYDGPTVLPRHSLTLDHPKWPCEIDLHLRFPGFFADPSDVFELLWERRTEVEIAARPVLTCDPLAHSLVAALHTLRGVRTERTRAVLEDLATRVQEHVPAAERAELVGLAARTGASDAARPFLEMLGLDAGPVVESDQLQAWRLLKESPDTTSVAWVLALRRAPAHRWPGLVARAIWLSESELRRGYPGTPPGRRALWRVRVQRWRRGLEALPVAVRGVRRHRRAGDPDGRS